MCIFSYMNRATEQNGLSAKLPLFFMDNGVKDETTAFESWQTNRLEWQYFWRMLSLRWPEIWWQFQKKSIKPSTL